MALSFLSSFFLISVLVLLFISPSFAWPSIKAGAGNSLIYNACQKTKNMSRCVSILESDPRSRTAQKFGLCEIIIELATRTASATTRKIQSLSLGARTPKQKYCFDTCADHYVVVGYELQNAKDYLKSGDYANINLCATGAALGAENCDKACSLSPLTVDNRNLEDLCDIMTAIDNLPPR